MSSVDQALGELGLSHNEIVVYKALLKNGTARATELARWTGLTKSTAQFTCQQLHRQGIVSMVRRKNVYLFSVDDTRRLLGVLDAHRLAIDQKREQISRVLPELEGLRGEATGLPRVHFYEEAKGVATAWQAFMSGVPPGSVVCSFAHPLNASSARIAVLEQFMGQRQRRRITAHVIVCDTPAARSLQANDATMLRETRIMTGRCCHMFSSEVMFAGDLVCLVTLQDGQECATTIENPPLARLLQTVFDGYWAALDPALRQ